MQRLHGTGTQLLPEAGVHHATLPETERRGGARDPDAEGAMRAPAVFRKPGACYAVDR